jgi:mono/diheme cytochrome c family protein
MSLSRITVLVLSITACAALLVAAAPAQTSTDSVGSFTGPDSPVAGADGKAVYMKKCKKCHGPDGKAQTKMGKKHEMGPIPGKLDKAKIMKVIKNGKANTKMKSFKEKLTEEEIDAVATFVKTL